MTVFVVSLFLPHTINFNLPTRGTSGDRRPRQSSRRKSSISKQTQDIPPSLFVPRSLTPPRTPSADADTEDFFAQSEAAFRRAFPGAEDVKSKLAPSDKDLTTWGGKGAYIQPKSRASSPPPKSILEHAKLLKKAESMGRAGIRQPQTTLRSDSHDRVFAEAGWTVEPAEQGNGGLRNAVHAAVRSGALEDPIWVGTLGMPTDALEGTQQKQDIQERLEAEHDSLTVFCKDSDFDGHYNHYCKQILWPVFHYQIPDNPKSKAYEDHSWVYYENVNQAFADKIVKNWKRGDIIWVHDYHLLLVPGMVRQKIPDAKIAFFLHVAFPSSEVFRCLAVRKQLLEGMLGANLVGFQIQEYARHFYTTVSRLLCVEATAEGVQMEDRFVNITDLPVGIDPVALNDHRKEKAVEEWLTVMQERYRGKKLIVARDKLDHVRGIRPKLLAYELFLNKFPEWRDRVVMIQVATSSTEQSELDATVSDIVTRVNSSWANLAYQPLVYLKQDISYAQYLALLTVADTLMITSQREGMNLTCHEYLVCQDGTFEDHNKHGSLILSEFTGSASIFKGNELSVNPWDYNKCAKAIKQALEMEDEEKEKRWTALSKVVSQHTADNWVKSILATLEKVCDEHQRRDTTSVPRLSTNDLSRQYQMSSHRLFILDYEGTLASWGTPTSIIHKSPQRTLDVLNSLLLDPRNTVYVMSSQTPKTLDQLFKHIPSLGLVAENGCFIKYFTPVSTSSPPSSPSTAWESMASASAMQEWKDSVTGIMKYYQERTPGSWIENRNCQLIFHYEKAEDKEAASRQAGDCASHINDACEEQRVRAIPSESSVVVEPIDWSKSTAAELILNDMKEKNNSDEAPIDFLMVAGDGREDEIVFRWANDLENDGGVKHVTTVTLGSRNTEAKSTLTQGVTGVLTALQKLAAIRK